MINFKLIHTYVYSRHLKTKINIYKECFEKGVKRLTLCKKLPKEKSLKYSNIRM